MTKGMKVYRVRFLPPTQPAIVLADTPLDALEVAIEDLDNDFSNTGVSASAIQQVQGLDLITEITLVARRLDVKRT